MLMSREQRVIDTFVYLADTLVTEFDADELLQVLAARCVELLDVDAAGVMLGMRPDRLRAVAATGRDMRLLEIFEVAASEGPSYDAFDSQEPVVVHDLTGTEERWPQFTPRALQQGFRTAYGFPLGLRERAVGALNLFQEHGRRRLDDADRRLAQGFADVAAIGLVQERLQHEATTRVEELSYALDARVVVEQAKGVLSERLSLTPMEAVERLRRYARDRNAKLRDVAQDLVEGRLDVP